MSGGNQEIDQQFDDDYMLQLALSMSLQNAEPQSPPAATPMEETEETPALPEPLVADPESVAAAVELPTTPEPSALAPMVESEPPPAAAAAATAAAAAAAAAATATAAAAAPKKAKKRVKKNKYKDLIAGVTASTRTAAEDKEVFEASLKKTTGGGAFTKVEKI